MPPTPVGDFGPYRIEELLGRGGMGVVYRAVDDRLGRQVALKLLAAEVADDERFRERFLRESRAAASIDHPGVLPIYEAGEVDGVLFIAMRYVEGEDLARVLRREGSLEPARAVALIEQLGAALDTTHRRGLVHRDVKPSNVLVSTEGGREHAYLTDFGITKQLSGTQLTGTGGLVGTVAYSAPEVIRAEAVDGRADVYSLGCLLYELLAGAVPFARDSEVAVVYAHLEETPPPIRDGGRPLPAGLDAVIRRALAKNPADRYQTAGELAAAAAAAIGPAGLERSRRKPAVDRRRLWAAAALLAAVGVAAVIAKSIDGGDGGTVAAIDADAVAVIDPAEGTLTDQIAVGASPSHMAAGGGAVWVTNADDHTVSRIDPPTRAVVQTVRVGATPSAIAVATDGVWVANSAAGTVSWISPATNEVVKTVRVGNGPGGVCVSNGSVWVAAADDRVIHRLTSDGRRAETVPVDEPPTEIACDRDRIWASSESSGRVFEIDASEGSVVRRIDVGGGASGIAVGRGAVWVANTLDGTVSRIDPLRGSVIATIPTGPDTGPAGIAIDAAGVWVADQDKGTLARIDVERNAVVQKLSVGGSPRALAVVDGRLWVGVRGTGARHRGGTLRVFATQPLSSPFDPATEYTAFGTALMSLVYDGLTAFRRSGGREGATLVPNLAVSLPAPVAGGRTYTFRLRRGIRYSTGEPVRAGDFRRGLERSIGTKGSPAGTFFERIEGAAACARRPSACDLSRGVVTDDAARTVAIHLTESDPELLHKLALPIAAPMPGSQRAPRAGHFAPATGPYRIGGVTEAELRLVRNPRFRSWSAAARPDAHPDAVTVRFDVAEREAAAAVVRGDADYAPVAPGADELAELQTRHAGQLHSSVVPVTQYYFLNTRVPPFDDVNARRAVNHAVDRRAAIEAELGAEFAEPTCQMLPPSFPGYRPYCPYSLGRPDLARARSLVERSGTRGAAVEVWAIEPQFVPSARVVARALRKIGYRASVNATSVDDYFSNVPAPRSRVQVGMQKWLADYPAASGFLRTLFACRTPDSGENWNWSRFCDRDTQELIDEALRVQARDVAAADAIWARVDRSVVDMAATVPLFNPKGFDFVSTRVRGYRRHPQWGLLLDQLWLR